MKTTVTIETWDDKTGNKQQQYLTHGAFRYFGKLPPTLTRKILTLQGVGGEGRKDYVELMCGSGTGILEALLLGANATGVDCNPLALLASRVKTTPLTKNELEALVPQFKAALHAKEIKAKNPPPPKIRNLNKWFNPTAQEGLAALRDWIMGLPSSPNTDVLLLSFASCIRPCSNASVRTGRLFHDIDKTPPFPMEEFEKKLRKLCASLAELQIGKINCAAKTFVESDARKTGLAEGAYQTGLCHPPYFALYRYSSDVLRFELEWLNFNRTQVAKREIEDGFKTTDETLAEVYVSDMVDVAKEARRIIAKGGTLAVVTADSTLRKQRLSIIQPFIRGAEAVGWKLERHAVRKVYFAQASYHKSADPEIVRPEDEVMFFRAT
jgi:hypothetical protein